MKTKFIRDNKGDLKLKEVTENKNHVHGFFIPNKRPKYKYTWWIDCNSLKAYISTSTASGTNFLCMLVDNPSFQLIDGHQYVDSQWWINFLGETKEKAKKNKEIIDGLIKKRKEFQEEVKKMACFVPIKENEEPDHCICDEKEIPCALPPCKSWKKNETNKS